MAGGRKRRLKKEAKTFEQKIAEFEKAIEDFKALEKPTLQDFMNVQAMSWGIHMDLDKEWRDSIWKRLRGET
jgi:hypothetical protein